MAGETLAIYGRLYGELSEPNHQAVYPISPDRKKPLDGQGLLDRGQGFLMYAK